MPFDMANLKPDLTGVGTYIHVFQDVDRRAKHGPRIKVFPGKPHEGNATSITIPTRANELAHVVGKATIKGKTLKRALEFAKLNWAVLSIYWYHSEYGVDELLEDLVAVSL